MTSLETRIFRSAARTFEELTFLFTERGEDLPDVACPGAREKCGRAQATIVFTGPLDGQLLLRVSENLLPELAANMLGEDDQRPESERWDALGEVANVVCGNLLPGLAGNKAVFRLQAPRMEACGVEETPPEHLKARVPFTLEGGCVELLLCVRGELPDLPPPSGDG